MHLCISSNQMIVLLSSMQDLSGALPYLYVESRRFGEVQCHLNLVQTYTRGTYNLLQTEKGRVWCINSTTMRTNMIILSDAPNTTLVFRRH